MESNENKADEVNWQIRQTWGKLTNEDIDLLQVSDEELIGLVQNVYGYSLEDAQEELDRFKLNKSQYFRDNRETINQENTMASTQYGGQMDTSIKSKAQHLVEEDIIEPAQKYMAKAREYGSLAVDKGADIVRENPGYSILGAAAVGFLAGAYFSRRR